MGNSLADTIEFNLLGLKAGLSGKRRTVYGAFNTSFGDTDRLNLWGGNPACAGTIFSRNAYRKRANVWGAGGKDSIMKELSFMIDSFDYGKSESTGTVGGIGDTLTALKNARELERTLVWKPKQVKELMLKTFYANRASEYNGSNGKKRQQNHWRIILNDHC